MKKCTDVRQHASKRQGIAAIEVVMAAAVVLVFSVGMYLLGQNGFSGLYHFISTLVGSPY
jgi:hypothetical protein